MIINDFNDPGVNDALRKCAIALKTHQTETFVLWDGEEDIASVDFPTPRCNKIVTMCSNHLTGEG